jgi:signal transduction histidine kinase
MIKLNNNNPKLSTRLSVSLAVVLLVVLIIATITAAISSYLEAREIQDETLLSVGYLVGSGQVSVQYDRNIFKDDDVDEGVQVWEVGNNSSEGFKIKPSISAGFHTMNARKNIWRVLIVKDADSNKTFAVAQKQSVNAELALKSAKNTALPLLGLLLLLPFLIYFVVRYCFKPLSDLSHSIESSDSLLPVNVTNKDIPYEVKPFVASIDALLKKNHEHIERQRRFIADAAHELRTPITALSLEIENLTESKDEDTRQKRQNSLFNSAERLQRLVNQLLDLARSQSVTNEEIETVDVNDLVKEQVSQLLVLADRKNIEIELARSEPVSMINSKGQLQHLIQNALSNAIKFTPDNGTVEIEIYQENGRDIFCVSDNGPGATTEDLARLAEPFYRSAEHATGTGAGLGLAICQEIATNLGGELSFGNGSKGGFKFVFTQKLPVSIAD